MSLRTWNILFVNTLILFTVVIISIFFYKEFKEALNKRVLLQLTSIKTLKSDRVKNYLESEWNAFQRRAKDMDSTAYSSNLFIYPGNREPLPYLDSIISLPKPVGIHDITSHARDGRLLLLFIEKTGDKTYLINYHRAPKIQQILLGRSGMGKSGETYIAGPDYHLRTESRFTPNKPPYEIIAETKGVKQGLRNIEETGIFKDYRGVMVYSAYHPIDYHHLRWVILSEIDVSEVTEPFISLRNRLIIISIIVLFLALLISLYFTGKVSRPVQKVSALLNKMAEGDYNVPIVPSGPGTEVKQLYHSLSELQISLNRAIEFANEIGMMKLNSSFTLAGKSDPLGESLISMRSKLLEFQRIEERNQQISKQSLIEGQENERKRLSRELHDGLGPLLTSLKLMVQSVKIETDQKEELKKVIDGMINEIRRMSYDLMPQSLLDFGVGKAVNNWVNVIKKNTTLNIQYRNGMNDSHVISQDINICLFRVIQELLNNTIKHARASQVRLSLTEFEDKVCLYYLDDGIGFDPNSTHSGSGLLNLKERVEVLNGEFIVNSNDQGTEVEVEIPKITAL